MLHFYPRPPASPAGGLFCPAGVTAPVGLFFISICDKVVDKTRQVEFVDQSGKVTAVSAPVIRGEIAMRQAVAAETEKQLQKPDTLIRKIDGRFGKNKAVKTLCCGFVKDLPGVLIGIITAPIKKKGLLTQPRNDIVPEQDTVV